MTENPVELAEEAVALKLIATNLYARAEDLSARAAKAMGRGTLYPKLADGTELACFVVPADSETVDIDVALLLPWVAQYYPTEIMQTVRPAFLELVRQSSKAAKCACGPNGEVAPPGVTYWLKPNSPKITPRPAGKVRAQMAVDAVLSQAFTSFAHLEIEGETT